VQVSCMQVSCKLSVRILNLQNLHENTKKRAKSFVQVVQVSCMQVSCKLSVRMLNLHNLHENTKKRAKSFVHASFVCKFRACTHA
jgi:hypothetical protein